MCAKTRTAAWAIPVGDHLLEAAKRCGGRRRDGVNGFPLRTAIVVVDPIALVVAPHEASAHEVRDSAADVAATGAPHPLSNFGSYHTVRFDAILRERVLLQE